MLVVAADVRGDVVEGRRLGVDGEWGVRVGVCGSAGGLSFGCDLSAVGISALRKTRTGDLLQHSLGTASQNRFWVLLLRILEGTKARI